MNSLTVIVCTHNRSSMFWKLLKSINDADRPSEMQIRLLIVANACSDDTENVLQEYKLRQQEHCLPLEWLSEPEIGKTNALNAALKWIDTDLVAFVDDDHRVDRRYFYEIQQSIINYPETGLFCGRIVPDWASVPLPRERFWDIQVAKIDSPTRQPLCPGRPAVAAALHFAEHHSAHNDWTACRMRLHMTCAGYGSLRLLRHFGHTPALYAYRGLSASGFALPWRTAMEKNLSGCMSVDPIASIRFLSRILTWAMKPVK